MEREEILAIYEAGPDYHLRIRNTLTLDNLAIAPGYQSDKQFG